MSEKLTDQECQEASAMLLRYAGLVRAEIERSGVLWNVGCISGPVEHLLKSEEKQAQAMAARIFAQRSGQ